MTINVYIQVQYKEMSCEGYVSHQQTAHIWNIWFSNKVFNKQGKVTIRSTKPKSYVREKWVYEYFKFLNLHDDTINPISIKKSSLHTEYK